MKLGFRKTLILVPVRSIFLLFDFVFAGFAILLLRRSIAGGLIARRVLCGEQLSGIFAFDLN